MNYPIWEITGTGGGFLIALISVLHVYISHLAVGGGIFLWLTDLKGFRENNRDIQDYVHKHTRFFLYLTLVFGTVSGVGIWFIIALVHPSATSTLIHQFVFAWAMEWVCFTGEIIALLIYYYKFHTLKPKDRLAIAFLYALFAWLSLVIINGILTFMLTPGDWMVTGRFSDGFFNPGFLPGALFRTFAAVMIAGIFAYITILRLKDEDFRRKMLKYASKWLIISVIGLVPAAVWYFFSIPEKARETAFIINPAMQQYNGILLISTILIFVGGVLLSLRSRLLIQRFIAVLLVALGLFWMGGFEYTREIARKPYIIYDYMYSNSIKKSEIKDLNRTGILSSARWINRESVNDSNRIDMGKEIFYLECFSCHTIDGIQNDIIPKIEGFTEKGISALLTGLGKLNSYMPPFAGTEEEKLSLSAFLGNLSNPDSIHQQSSGMTVHSIPDIFPFNKDSSQYVLLAWNSYAFLQNFSLLPYFRINPPDNSVNAILIRRGEIPEIVSGGIEIVIKLLSQENPGNFKSLPGDNAELFNFESGGKFKYDPKRNLFFIKIPPIQEPAAERYFRIEARDSKSQVLLISTLLIPPQIEDYKCGKCHKGNRKEIAENILKAHDRLSRTSLFKDAEKGMPRDCSSCHGNSRKMAEKGRIQQKLSASVHGFHALYISPDDSELCLLCHSVGSRDLQGFHRFMGVTCIDCHGGMDEMSFSLLTGNKDQRNVKRILNHLNPTEMPRDEILPRSPWDNQPDCRSCHEGFEQPEPNSTSFNKWNTEISELYRNRTDYVNIPCSACHGSAHLEYPVYSSRKGLITNLQPVQYSGEPFPIGSNLSCEICHGKEMEYPIHHENMARMFRNSGPVKQR